MFSSLKLVLLDRDGVINFDSPDYIRTPKDWQPIPGSLHAIARLQAAGVGVSICTNQAGIGRGLFDEAALQAIHRQLNDELEHAGGQRLDIFYCSHHPNVGCACRKPQPGLLTAAMQAHNVQPKDVTFVGDSERDLIAADNAGCRAVLVLTGNGRRTAQTERGRTVTTFADLAELVDAILV